MLADWWAETLEWVVEPQDEAFIRSMVEQGFATDEETTTHNGKLVWRTGAAIIPSEDQDKATGKRVLFQAVPEGKSTKNRVHLDVRLAGRDKDVVRAALEERGAAFLWTAGQGPHELAHHGRPRGQ